MASPSDFFRRLDIDGGSFYNNNGTEKLLLSADVSLTVDQASEIQFAMHDPNWNYLKTFGEKGPLGKSARYGEMQLTVSGYTIDGGPSGTGGTMIKMQPAGIVKSRNIKGPLSRENISPTQFVKDGARSAGMACVAQDSPVRPAITRDVPDEQSSEDDKNEWTTLNRLAAEEGFLIYECMNTLYFGSPQWLFDTRPSHVVGLGNTVPREEDKLMAHPTVNMSLSENTSNDISFQLPLDKVGRLLPGHGITVMGAPGLGGKKLLVTSVAYPLAGNGVMDVQAKAPWIIEKQALESEKSKDSVNGGGGGGATAAAGTKFRYQAGKDEGQQAVDAAMEFLGITYSWGGGNFQGPTKGIRDGGVADQHGDYNKVGFDCSGLTLYACYQGTNGRVQLGHYTGTQINQGRRISAGEVRAGDLVFPHANHVAICMGNGKMIEAPQSGDVVKISNLRGGTFVRVI